MLTNCLFQFHCCGNGNYSDWFKVTWDKKESPPNRTTVPKSCCKDMETGCNSYGNVHNATVVEKFIYTEVGMFYHRQSKEWTGNAG